MALSDIAAQLAEPFDIGDIDFLPKGSFEKEGKTMCMALPYADPRVYQDRLNKLAPGEWSTPAPIAVVVGNKLITYVTVVICGIPHTDVGEADAGENQGTEAWAQAFKRACSQFGLGRYLYSLEKAWVPYSKQRKQIDLDAAGMRATVRGMYQKAGIPVPGQPVAKPAATNNHRSENPSDDPDSPYTWAKVQALAKESELFTEKGSWGAFLRKSFPNVPAPEIEQSPAKRAILAGEIKRLMENASVSPGK